jgi:hypothetical protein
MTIEGKQINLITQEFDNAKIDRFIFAVQRRMETLYAAPIPHTKEMIAKFLNVSERTVHSLTKDGLLPVHYLPGLKIPYWFPDECSDCIRRYKR